MIYEELFTEELPQIIGQEADFGEEDDLDVPEGEDLDTEEEDEDENSDDPGAQFEI